MVINVGGSTPVGCMVEVDLWVHLRRDKDDC